MGLWSTITTSSSSSQPLTDFTCAGSSSHTPPLATSAFKYTTSCASVLLPEPLTPVRQANTPRGIFTFSFFRLCRVAPEICKNFPGLRLFCGMAMRRLPDRNAPVRDSGTSAIQSGAPEYTRRPPSRPEPGPMSTRQSAARITASSCSTTTNVFPRVLRRFMAEIRREVSLGCRPTVGSSSTNSVSVREAPKQVVRLTRSISPPERVRVARSELR